jgi:hypothetical protein
LSEASLSISVHHSDQTAILVTGKGVDKLLGVPKSHDGTGKTISDMVMSILQELEHEDKITAMCFDTTAANTGRLCGTCTLLEGKIEIELLHLACRHHTHDITLTDVYKCCIGPSSGPDIKLLQSFKKNWSALDKDKFSTAIHDQECSQVFEDKQSMRDEMLSLHMRHSSHHVSQGMITQNS